MRYEVAYGGHEQFWVIESEVELRVGDIIWAGRQELRVAGRTVLTDKLVVSDNEYRVRGFRLVGVPVTNP